MQRFPRLIFLALLLAALASCRSTNQFLKAKAADPSPFLEHQNETFTDRERVPFHRIWRPRDQRDLRTAASRTDIFIAPVRLDLLRPVSQALARKEIEVGGIARREQNVAAHIRSEFTRAFMNSPGRRYRPVSAPGKNSVTLELALIELNPTSPTGNGVKMALKFVIGPFAGLGGYFTKGNIAIEGKLRDSRTGALLFQFADNQSDKMTFYSLRDFYPYAHANAAIKEWAEAFELFTRTPASYRVEGSLCFTLDPTTGS